MESRGLWSDRVKQSYARELARVFEKVGFDSPKLLDLTAKVKSSVNELAHHRKLAREEYAKLGNSFREMGALLVSLRDISPEAFKARFLGPNADASQFPFTYEKARAIMRFAAQNPRPITRRKLDLNPGLINKILDISEMT
jgi:hypothetical protein